MSDQEYQQLETQEKEATEKCKQAEDAARRATNEWYQVHSAMQSERQRREVERLVQQRLAQAKEIGKALACGCRSLEEAR